MNPTASFQFTIIVPVYNEREGLLRLENSLAAYLEKALVRPACVLLVDDGSTDGGSALIEEICARHADFFFLRFARNCGLSAALKAGFEAAISTPTCRPIRKTSIFCFLTQPDSPWSWASAPSAKTASESV